MRPTFLILIWTLLLSAGLHDSAAAPTFTGLGQAGMSRAYAVSADGVVVVGELYWGNSAAFLWTEAGGLKQLAYLMHEHLRPYQNVAAGTSSDGSVIVGFGSVCCPWYYRVARWSGSPEQDVEDLGEGTAWAVSADGSVIVGNYPGNWAFRWTRETGIVGLGFVGRVADISGDGGTVVGDTDFGAFRWTEATGPLSLGAPPSSYAKSISADGTAVVGALAFQGEAFRWTQEAGVVGLGFLPGSTESEAVGVSNGGAVVVGNSGQAFIWDAVHGMRSLKDVLVNDYDLDLTGWDLDQATDVSADGLTVVGYGTNPDGLTEAWMARLSEPAPVVPGDFDHDGDVDQCDFGHLQACLTGPDEPQNDTACQDALLDEDQDVDDLDIAVFKDCMSGAGVPGDPDCDQH